MPDLIQFINEQLDYNELPRNISSFTVTKTNESNHFLFKMFIPHNICLIIGLYKTLTDRYNI